MNKVALLLANSGAVGFSRVSDRRLGVTASRMIKLLIDNWQWNPYF